MGGCICGRKVEKDLNEFNTYALSKGLKSKK